MIKIIYSYCIKEINNDIAEFFLKNNGSRANSDIYMAACCENDIYAVMCINIINKDEFKVVNYCNKKGYKVNGGMTNISESIRIKYHPKKIIISF